MPSWLAKAAYMGFKEEFVVPTTAASIPRFSMLVCGMFCSIAIGALYAYSLITKRLTDDFHFTQNDITTISTVGIVIGYCTLPFGIIYDYVGPKPIFAMGLIFNALGTLLFALTFEGKIGHSVGGLAIINAVMNLGSALFDMGSILTVLSWFPLDRGLVVACMKTTTGLGSSFISTLYGTYFNNDNSRYMYFLMAWSIVIGLIAIVVVYLPPFHVTGLREKAYTDDRRLRAVKYQNVYMRHKAPIKRFVVAFCLVIALLITICTRSVVFVFVDSPTNAQMNPPAIIMIVLYVLLLCTALPIPWLDSQPGSYDSEHADGYVEDVKAIERRRYGAADEEEMVGLDPAEAACAMEMEPMPGADKAQAAGNTPDAQEDSVEAASEPPAKKSAWREFVDAIKPDAPAKLSVETNPQTREEVLLALETALDLGKIAPQFPTGFLYNVRRPTLICLWLTGFCVSGAVNTIMMNSTQIYLAIGEDETDTVRPALYVALTSIGSAVGRLIMAFVEVFTQSTAPEKRLPITLFYCIPPTLCLLSCVFFLFIPTPGLLLPMLLAGLGNGFYAAAEVLTVRTIFSLDVAKHYNSLFFAEMLAVIFMNRLLFGEIMTKNSTPGITGAPVCLGRKKCVQTTFIVLTCLCAAGVVASVVMNLTYVRFAKKEYARRREYIERLHNKLAELDSAAPHQESELEPQQVSCTEPHQK